MTDWSVIVNILLKLLISRRRYCRIGREPSLRANGSREKSEGGSNPSRRTKKEWIASLRSQ